MIFELKTKNYPVLVVDNKIIEEVAKRPQSTKPKFFSPEESIFGYEDHRKAIELYESVMFVRISYKPPTDVENKRYFKLDEIDSILLEYCIYNVKSRKRILCNQHRDARNRQSNAGHLIPYTNQIYKNSMFVNETINLSFPKYSESNFAFINRSVDEVFINLPQYR